MTEREEEEEPPNAILGHVSIPRNALSNLAGNRRVCLFHFWIIHFLGLIF